MFVGKLLEKLSWDTGPITDLKGSFLTASAGHQRSSWEDGRSGCHLRYSVYNAWAESLQWELGGFGHHTGLTFNIKVRPVWWWTTDLGCAGLSCRLRVPCMLCAAFPQCVQSLGTQYLCQAAWQISIVEPVHYKMRRSQNIFRARNEHGS